MADQLSNEQKIAEARAQALANAEASFDELDLNNDGSVSKAEVIELSKKGSAIAGSADSAKIDEFIATFDTDGDGMIQKAEWLEFFGNLFDSVIANTLEQ